MKCVGEDHGVCQCLWGPRRARLFLFVHIASAKHRPCCIIKKQYKTWAKARRNWNCKTSLDGQRFFFMKRDFFVKDSWQAPNYCRFFNWKTGISKAWRKMTVRLSTPFDDAWVCIKGLRPLPRLASLKFWSIWHCWKEKGSTTIISDFKHDKQSFTRQFEYSGRGVKFLS